MKVTPEIRQILVAATAVSLAWESNDLSPEHTRAIMELMEALRCALEPVLGLEKEEEK